jgi:5-enolpyruvylshikimate-3-phosphate synthase
MAMSFATLGMLAPVELNIREVVNKSYPGLWEDIERMGSSMAIVHL